MFRHSLTTAAVLALMGPAIVAENGSPNGRLTLEDLAAVPQLGSPVLSPDGKQFALIRDGQIVLLPWRAAGLRF